MVNRIITLAVLAAVTGAPALAQGGPSLAPKPTPSQHWRSFKIETAAGILGSGIGFGLVAAVVDECTRDEDVISCTIGPAAGALAASTTLSVVSVALIGKHQRTDPSVAGAIVGAIAGAAAAVGVDHLLREEMDVRMSRFGTGVAVAVTQGIVTAVGSRLFAAIRR